MPFSDSLSHILTPSKEDALKEWGNRVRENRQQAEKFREAPERTDFYGPTSAAFKVDPDRKGDASLEIISGIAKRDQTWLDIGAGAGRYTLPLAPRVREVIAVEPSESMASLLSRSMKEREIRNIRLIKERWPLNDLPKVDVALISHVGYDIEEIGPFLDAMETSASQYCVAVLLDSAPTAMANFFWPRIHGEKRVPLPALREFLILQIARGRLCEVNITPRDARFYPNEGMAASFLRQQLFIEPGGAKDRLLHNLIKEHHIQENGQLTFSGRPSLIGIAIWKTRDGGGSD